MATRRERVVVEAVDNYSGELLRMAAATEAFRRNLDASFRGSGDSFRQVRTELDQTARVFTRTSRQVDSDTRRMSATIDQFSGRVQLLARGIAVLAPTVGPITTSLVPAISGLASQLGFAALAGGTAVIAFQGFGDALEAVNDAALEPTAENLEEARAAMARLSPEARTLVRQIQDMRPAFTALRDSAAGGLFPGLTEALQESEALFPRLERILATVGDASGDLLAGGVAELASEEWEDFFSYIQSEARPTLITFGQTLGDLTKGVAELWMAMDPLSDDFTGGLRNMAADFEAWAEALSTTQGYSDFIAYVRETGPQVLDTLGSLANMLIQIATAAAPLGGPTLAVIEALADSISAIAESNLGTPIAAIIALSSAVRLLSQATTALRGVDLISAVTGGLAGGTAGTSVIASTRTQVQGLAADLRQVRAASIGVGPLRGGAEARMSSNFAAVAAGASLADVEARNRLNSSIRETASVAGRAAGPMAALGLAASGMADGFAAANTATFALMGSFAGIPGLVGGAVVGGILDLAAANDDLVAAIQRADLAVESLDYDQMIAAQRNLNQAYSEQLGFTAGLRSTMPALGGIYDRVFGKTDEGARAQERLSAATRDARNQLRGMAGTLPAVERQSGTFEAQMRQQAAALRENRTAARGTAQAFFNIGNAVGDGRRSLAGFLRSLENQAEALRNFRLNAERAARRGLDEGLIASLQEAGPAGAQSMRQLANATNSEIARANSAWRKGQAEVRRYTGAIGGVPTRVETDVVVDIGSAMRTIGQVQYELQQLDGNRATTYVETVYTSSGRRFKDVAPTGFNGGYFPERGFFSAGYTGNISATDIAGIVHGREVVIPAWLAKRDAALLKARYGFLPGMSNLQGFFGGGFVDRRGHSSQSSVSVAAPNVTVGGTQLEARFFMDGREFRGMVRAEIVRSDRHHQIQSDV